MPQYCSMVIYKDTLTYTYLLWLFLSTILPYLIKYSQFKKCKNIIKHGRFLHLNDHWCKAEILTLEIRYSWPLSKVIACERKSVGKSNRNCSVLLKIKRTAIALDVLLMLKCPSIAVLKLGCRYPANAGSPWLVSVHH